jgi:radical SAM protein with 4Fe4S-binding SPASM domain
VWLPFPAARLPSRCTFGGSKGLPPRRDGEERVVELPTLIEIEPTQSCNLRCRMCHVSFMPQEPRPALDPGLIDQLEGLHGTYFFIGSNFEPMMNRGFAQMIRKLTAMGGAMEIITNGTLLDEENVAALVDADLRQVIFSFDGMSESTYEYIRRGAKYRRTLDAIVDFRRRFEKRETRFSVNYTVMRRNLPELVDAVAFWDRAGFDMLGLITMVIRENDPELIQESLYPVRDEYHRALDAAALDVIENKRAIMLTNPWYRQTPLISRFPKNFAGNIARSGNRSSRFLRSRRRQQYGAGPGMSFPCKSPWNFAKIMPNGDVQLCYQFTIGNLAEESFQAIWFGERAEAVRRRVVAERGICEACDYFRFCIAAGQVDDEDKRSHLAGQLLAGTESIDFASGTMGPVPPAPPQLVETVDAYNIVRFNGSYLGVPQALGPIDLDAWDLAGLPGLLRGDNLRAMRQMIRARTAEDAHSEEPQLIEELGDYNIVRFGDAYLGVPHDLGPIDLSEQDLAALPGLFRGETLNAVRDMIITGK